MDQDTRLEALLLQARRKAGRKDWEGAIEALRQALDSGVTPWERSILAGGIAQLKAYRETGGLLP